MPVWNYSGNIYSSSPAGTTVFPLVSEGGNPIEYLQRSHIHVSSSDDKGYTWTVLNTPSDYSFNTAGTEIILSVGIADGVFIRVMRHTPYLNEYVEFQSSSLLTADQLNTAELFSMYVDQEQADQINSLNSVAIKYLGAIDLTVDPPPVIPKNGDFFINTGAGVVVAGWTGIEGDTVVGSEQVIYNGLVSEWEIFGVPSSQIGVLSVTGTAPVTVDNTDIQRPIVGIDNATPSADGAMSAADKTKLDGIPADAVPEAPSDGKLYGRKDAAWSEVDPGGVTQITAGQNITISPVSGVGNVTVNADSSGTEIAPTPPPNPSEGDVWWDDVSGVSYVYYTDSDSSQWVEMSPARNGGTDNFVLKTGDKMTGDLQFDSASPANLSLNIPVLPNGSATGSVLRFNTTDTTGIVDGTAPNDSTYFNYWGAYRNQTDRSVNVFLSKTAYVTTASSSAEKLFLECKHDGDSVARIGFREYLTGADWFGGDATFTGNVKGGLVESRKIWNARPSNFWSTGSDYIGVGTSDNDNFAPYGALTSGGAYAVSLCGNGYRNDTGGWTRHQSATGEVGGTEIRLVPTGEIIFYSDTNISSSTTVPTQRGKFNNSGLTLNSLTGSGNRAVYSTSGGTLSNSSSDATLKTNVKALSSQVDVVKALRPVSYNWIDTEERGAQPEIGFIAQEVQELVPEVVGVNSDETLSVDYPKMVATLTSALQETLSRVEALEAQISTLQGGN